MSMCIYCGDRVGIVCDSCAGTAQERDEWRQRCAVLEADNERLCDALIEIRDSFSDDSIGRGSCASIIARDCLAAGRGEGE